MKKKDAIGDRYRLVIGIIFMLFIMLIVGYSIYFMVKDWPAMSPLLLVVIAAGGVLTGIIKLSLMPKGDKEK